MSINKIATYALTYLLLVNSFVVNSQEILVVGNYNNPPKIYWKDNKPQGILVDILKYVESQSNYKISIELYPWKRAFSMGNNGERGIIGLSKTNERLENFDYSDEIFLEEIILVVTKGNEFDFNSLNDLKGKIVGANRGAKYGELFVEGYQKYFSLSEDGGAEQRLNKLLKDRIDVGIFGPGKYSLLNALAVNEQLKAQKNEFIILDKPFIQNPTYLGFSKKQNKKEFLKKFNLILAEAKKDGTISQIISKYTYPRD